MKKIFLLIAAFVDSMSISAQTINVYKGGSIVKSYYASEVDSVVLAEGGTPEIQNLLPGKFSVSATKQVQFTKSNLYWDDSSFHFETNQTDNPTTWDKSHVGHFYWTKLTDYTSGKPTYMPYAEGHIYSSQTTYDKFWCGEDNKLAVDGTDNLYVLTGGSSDEWYYLLKSRANANSLYKNGVTVTNDGKCYKNCLIIAPDGFTGILQSSYTLDEVNAAGLVCLPAAGSRYDGSCSGACVDGSYSLTTPDSFISDYAYDLYFDSNNVICANKNNRGQGLSLRLVRNF